MAEVQSLIQQFVLSAYYVSGTVLGGQDTQAPASIQPAFLGNSADSKIWGLWKELQESYICDPF